MKKRQIRRYTAEQKEFLKKIIPSRGYNSIIAMFNARYADTAEPITINQLRNFIKNNGVTTGRDGRFKKGHKTHNKGKKVWWTINKTAQFKKGHIPANHKPVGSKRITKNGYTKIKVSEPNKWQLLHHVIWEEANGPIPKGYIIIFADEDKSNITLNNLLLVSQAENMTMNKFKLRGTSKELTNTGLLVAKLREKMRKAAQSTPHKAEAES